MLFSCCGKFWQAKKNRQQLSGWMSHAFVVVRLQDLHRTIRKAITPVLVKSQTNSSTDEVKGVPLRPRTNQVPETAETRPIGASAAVTDVIPPKSNTMVVIGADETSALEGHRVVVTTNGQLRISLKRRCSSIKRSVSSRRLKLEKQLTVIGGQEAELPTQSSQESGYYSRSISVPMYLNCV